MNKFNCYLTHLRINLEHYTVFIQRSLSKFRKCKSL